MIRLEPFGPNDFDTVISWVDNEELLFTIAGTAFSYPLTHEQLLCYLDERESHSFMIVEAADNKPIGHAEIRLSGEKRCKIDKLLIGEGANRGKGIGKAVISQLLAFAFDKLEAGVVELYVFDWNKAGIRCYEQCGFVMNPEKHAWFQLGEKRWLALHMLIEKDQYLVTSGG